MPQFLRYVHVLCSLYQYYLSGVKQYFQSPEASLPVYTRANLSASYSASLHGSASAARDSSSTLNRVGSVDGGVLRTRSATTRTFLSTLGHQRTGSQGNPLELVARMESDVEPTCSVSLGSLASPRIPPNPLERMEIVWDSLFSWFDLLMKEVQKLHEVGEERSSEASSSSYGKEECPKAVATPGMKTIVLEETEDKPVVSVSRAPVSPGQCRTDMLKL